MNMIDATFYKFSEINLRAVMCEDGIYIFWGEGEKKSLWIGEGDLMQRLYQRSTQFRWTNGYVAIMDNKIESAIGEYALLNHAKETGRFPTINKQRGMKQTVIDFLKEYGKIKVNIKNRDPLIPPTGSNKLYKTLPIYLSLK